MSLLSHEGKAFDSYRVKLRSLKMERHLLFSYILWYTNWALWYKSSHCNKFNSFVFPEQLVTFFCSFRLNLKCLTAFHLFTVEMYIHFIEKPSKKKQTKRGQSWCSSARGVVFSYFLPLLFLRSISPSQQDFPGFSVFPHRQGGLS